MDQWFAWRRQLTACLSIDASYGTRPRLLPCRCPPIPDTSSASVAGRVLLVPGCNRRHRRLERTRVEVEDAGAGVAAVLEVVDDAAGDQHEGAARGVDPAVAEAEAHRALEHVEDVV